MKAPSQIKPPENWQDFETLCKRLWGEIWNCSDTIKKNGRSGQVQNGVDIYGAPYNGIEYYGIQCKGKDNYTKLQLTENEIDTEIEKAKKFKPQLKRFYFATTAVKDAKIEEYIRIKNVESQQQDSFAINVFAWEDIVDLLKENRNTFNWYINDCQYMDNTDVDIFFNNGEKLETINPIFYGTSKAFSPRIEDYQCVGYPQDDHDYYGNLRNYFNPNTEAKVDYVWCEVKIVIENIGSAVLDNYIVELQVGTDEKLNQIEIDNDSGAKAVVDGFSQRRQANFNSEVTAYEETRTIEYRPRKSTLIQNDRRFFRFYVKFLYEEIEIKWTVKAANYSKDGVLSLNCIPLVEPKFFRENIGGKKQEELNFEPKIAIER